MRIRNLEKLDEGIPRPKKDSVTPGGQNLFGKKGGREKKQLLLK
jgi:hypothetical protein